MTGTASPGVVALAYLLFFLSGAAALVYQVVWVRSLTLVFGGSHLAVTAVLSMFMGGLALGGYVFGRRADRAERPLRLYGWLELGIAASALMFAGLMEIYPAIYVAIARGSDAAPLYLTIVRLLFSAVALILPTMLMGGTLPVLSRFVARQPETLRGHLPFLYGINTLGAVVGALLAGFVLLRLYSVTAALSVAVVANVLIGLVALVLPGRADQVMAPSPMGEASSEIPTPSPARLPAGAVLWAIGVSGFCALGYEVLWTRVLTIAAGASVYAFTVMLVAFLTGIALGSQAYGVAVRIAGRTTPSTRTVVTWFGLTEVAIGIAALVVTVYLRDIPASSMRLRAYLLEWEVSPFAGRVWATFALAFLYMVVPAIFMGAAFPLAGEVLARHRRAIGRAVGEVLAANTVGAILGAVASGFVLIQTLGIERSLQVLTVLNVGVGLLVLASLRGPRALPAAVVTATLAAMAFLVLHQDAARIWDRKYFAIFRSNQAEAFRTPEMVQEAIDNTDVLYYAEGVESIVSVIKVKGGEQAFLTNGRIEASTHLQAQQCQFALGHLPMLLHPRPKDVLVVGLGSGMTAGATAVHPGVERVTLVEIEPKVLGVARTFDAYNHRVLDNPRVDIVVNDGRNFLMTTSRMFDVITADPIHPWFRGAGYLYSREYFRLAAEHLRPGGVIAQWLPIYELTPRDVASVVRTFQAIFPHTLLWLTHYDAEIVGSDKPFAIDEADLDRRIAGREVAADLARVTMGSAADLLAYFVMGSDGMTRLGESGIVNTDDNLYLEFSAPFSIASDAVMEANVAAITAHREPILPYLKPAADAAGRGEQQVRSTRQFAAGAVGDRALALYLGGRTREAEFTRLLDRLTREYPWHAPGRFLADEYQLALRMEPRLLQQSFLSLMDEHGARTFVELSAVRVPVSRTRASIMFVDNRAKVVYGQLFVDDDERGEFASRIAGDVMGAIRAAYQHEAVAARGRGRDLPGATETLRAVRAVIGSKVQDVRPES